MLSVSDCLSVVNVEFHRKRKAEAGRERQRQEDKGRGRYRQADIGRGSTESAQWR